MSDDRLLYEIIVSVVFTVYFNCRLASIGTLSVTMVTYRIISIYIAPGGLLGLE